MRAIVVGMARPNKIVILIAGDPADNVQKTHGDYSRIIVGAVGDAWDGAYEVVDARGDALPALAPNDAVIISGSAANSHHREPWMLRSEAWLADAVHRGTAVLGLCFGHQLLAQALGGEVAPNPRGREVGTVDVDRLDDDPVFEGVGTTFAANTCHLDTVVRLPAGATVLARSRGDDHQCIRFTPRCYGVQFHPEFDGELIRMFIEARSEAMRAEGLDPVTTRETATDTPLSRRVLHNFVRLVTS